MQSTIGASHALAFDLTAACSGFVVGLVTAAQFIRTGAARNVLVIGADALSRFVDWRDRGACLLVASSCLLESHRHPSIRVLLAGPGLLAPADLNALVTM